MCDVAVLGIQRTIFFKLLRLIPTILAEGDVPDHHLVVRLMDLHRVTRRHCVRLNDCWVTLLVDDGRELVGAAVVLLLDLGLKGRLPSASFAVLFSIRW